MITVLKNWKKKHAPEKFDIKGASSQTPSFSSDLWVKYDNIIKKFLEFQFIG